MSYRNINKCSFQFSLGDLFSLLLKQVAIALKIEWGVHMENSAISWSLFVFLGAFSVEGGLQWFWHSISMVPFPALPWIFVEWIHATVIITNIAALFCIDASKRLTFFTIFNIPVASVWDDSLVMKIQRIQFQDWYLSHSRELSSVSSSKRQPSLTPLHEIIW